MSILIKDMDMPETCEDCEFHRYHSNREYVCIATPLFYPMNLANSKGIRKDFCPLEEVPECEDAVNRKEVLALFAHNCDHVRPYMDTWEAVKRMTPVTPKRKTGKWIHSDFSHEFLHCSECGRGRHFCSNFCPNCGAKMDGRE